MNMAEEPRTERRPLKPELISYFRRINEQMEEVEDEEGLFFPGIDVTSLENSAFRGFSPARTLLVQNVFAEMHGVEFHLARSASCRFRVQFAVFVYLSLCSVRIVVRHMVPILLLTSPIVQRVLQSAPGLRVRAFWAAITPRYSSIPPHNVSFVSG